MKNAGSRDRSPVQLQLKHTLHGHTNAVTCIAASSAYNVIVSGSKVSCSIHYSTPYSTKFSKHTIFVETISCVVLDYEIRLWAQFSFSWSQIICENCKCYALWKFGTVMHTYVHVYTCTCTCRCTSMYYMVIALLTVHTSYYYSCIGSDVHYLGYQ